MRTLGRSLWTDEAGFLLSAELVLVATVAVLGLSVTLVAVRDSIGAEMTDLATAFRNIDQSYAYGGIRGCRSLHGYSSWTAGSNFLDAHLREADSEEEIIVDDHVVGTKLAVAGTCLVPAAPAPCPTNDCVPPCVTPCPVPGCEDCPPGIALLPAPDQSSFSPVISGPPTLPLQAPCVDCPPLGSPGLIESPRILPPPSSDIPPASVRRYYWNRYTPPFSQPMYSLPPGPLQVW